jgi:hypothetical protein
MNIEEYNAIREGLIALMCVGDRIFYIYHGLGSFNQETQQFDTTIKVKKCTITEIIDDGCAIKMVTESSYTSIQHTNMMDIYKGQLYIWNESKPTDRLARASKIASIMEHPDTMLELW